MGLKPNFDGQHQRFSRAFDLLRQAIAARAFPGCSLAVVHRGELVASAGFGRFTYEAQSPKVAADTIFDLASLTKIVATTTMAMILYERGMLDLDMPVQSVVREFAGKDPRREEVTIRALLAHTSGLPAYVRLFEGARTREELLLAACRTPLEVAPGESTVYSDIGFIVLGEALARLADELLDSFCRHEIFGPLGMARTCFNPPRELRPQIPPSEDDRAFRHRVIQGDVNDENASVMGGVAGHAGVFASAPDLACFAQSLLHGAFVVRADTLHLFAQPQPALSGNARALGFDFPSRPSQSGRYFTHRSLGHLGFTGTSLWMDPERDLAVVLLTNRTWPDRSSQDIKRVRPAVHDAIWEALESTPC
jgi:serine-type D-Ala-D-Ala carboxypeptidase